MGLVEATPTAIFVGEALPTAACVGGVWLMYATLPVSQFCCRGNRLNQRFLSSGMTTQMSLGGGSMGPS